MTCISLSLCINKEHCVYLLNCKFFQAELNFLKVRLGECVVFQHFFKIVFRMNFGLCPSEMKDSVFFLEASKILLLSIVILFIVGTTRRG